MLLKLAFEDDDSNIRSDAGGWLIGTVSSAVPRYVESHLAGMNEDRRLIAIGALEGRDDLLSQRLLFRSASDRNADVREGALYAIGTSQTARASRLRFLLKRLSSTSSYDETDATMMGLWSMMTVDAMREIDKIAKRKRALGDSISNDIRRWEAIMVRDKKIADSWHGSGN